MLVKRVDILMVEEVKIPSKIKVKNCSNLKRFYYCRYIYKNHFESFCCLYKLHERTNWFGVKIFEYILIEIESIPTFVSIDLGCKGYTTYDFLLEKSIRDRNLDVLNVEEVLLKNPSEYLYYSLDTSILTKFSFFKKEKVYIKKPLDR